MGENQNSDADLGSVLNTQTNFSIACNYIPSSSGPVNSGLEKNKVVTERIQRVQVFVDTTVPQNALKSALQKYIDHKDFRVHISKKKYRDMVVETQGHQVLDLDIENIDFPELHWTTLDKIERELQAAPLDLEDLVLLYEDSKDILSLNSVSLLEAWY